MARRPKIGCNYPLVLSLWSAPILLMGIVIQHNFIENHSTTNEVPSERAGADLELGENRWLDLIRLSQM